MGKLKIGDAFNINEYQNHAKLHTIKRRIMKTNLLWSVAKIYFSGSINQQLRDKTSIYLNVRSESSSSTSEPGKNTSSKFGVLFILKHAFKNIGYIFRIDISSTKNTNKMSNL